MINMTQNPYESPASPLAHDGFQNIQRKVPLYFAVLVAICSAGVSTVVAIYGLVIAPSPPFAPGRFTIQVFAALMGLIAAYFGWIFEWRSRTKLIVTMSGVWFAVFGLANYVLFQTRLTDHQFFPHYVELLNWAIALAIAASLIAGVVGTCRRPCQKRADRSSIER